MMNYFRIILALAAFSVSACATKASSDGGADAGSTSTVGVPGYRQLHAKYFSTAGGCASSSCHGGDKGIASLSFQDVDKSYKMLVGTTPTNDDAASAGLMRVKAGKPDESLVYLKLSASAADLLTKHYGATMPIGGEGSPGPKTLTAIKKWIEGGAPMEGDDVEVDTADLSAANTQWTTCAASDPSGLKACLMPELDPKKYIRVYTPPITVAPQSEITVCSYLDYIASDDILLRATIAKQMTGGHHAAVFVAAAPQANHTPHECTNAEMSNFRFVAAAGGSGSASTGLPDGVALKIQKGQQVVIQSHYHNTSGKPRVVMDAVDIELVNVTDPTKLKIADPFALISSNFTIPKGLGTFTSEKVCTLDRDMSIYMLLGHTHENGVLYTYERIPATTSTAELLYKATDGKLLRNTPETKMYATPLQWKKGDKLRMRCTWQQTDHPMTWPEEMCVGLVYYTDGAGFLTCDDGDETPKGGGAVVGCLPTDHKGNDIGVGKACTAAGNECADNLQATLCIAQFDATQNYCTFIGCDSDALCGKGAHCSKDPKGSACQPDDCK